MFANSVQLAVQIATALVSLACVAFLLRSPRTRSLPLFYLLVFDRVHVIVFYLARWYCEYRGIATYGLFNDWSSILRLGSALAVLAVIAWIAGLIYFHGQGGA